MLKLLFMNVLLAAIMHLLICDFLFLMKSIKLKFVSTYNWFKQALSIFIQVLTLI